MMELLRSPVFVVFASITIIGVVVTISEAWTKTKKVTLEAELKTEMIRQGMSADEICRVLEARPGRTKKHAKVDQA